MINRRTGDVIAGLLLPEDLAEARVTRILVREILATSVLQPLMSMMTPAFLNKFILLACYQRQNKSEPDQGSDENGDATEDANHQDASRPLQNDDAKENGDDQELDNGDTQANNAPALPKISSENSLSAAMDLTIQPSEAHYQIRAPADSLRWTEAECDLSRSVDDISERKSQLRHRRVVSADMRVSSFEPDVLGKSSFHIANDSAIHCLCPTKGGREVVVVMRSLLYLLLSLLLWTCTLCKNMYI